MHAHPLEVLLVCSRLEQAVLLSLMPVKSLVQLLQLVKKLAGSAEKEEEESLLKN